MCRQIAASACEPSAYAPVESGQKPRWKSSPAAFRPATAAVGADHDRDADHVVACRSGAPPTASLTISGSSRQAEPLA